MNEKKVSFLLMISAHNQINETMIVKVKGTHKMLYLKDDKTLPLNISSVARPIPQPGQGIPVANLKRQSVRC